MIMQRHILSFSICNLISLFTLNIGGRGYGVSQLLSEFLNRESLLDAFCLLYNECDKESLRKRDKHIAEFVNKCMFSV